MEEEPVLVVAAVELVDEAPDKALLGVAAAMVIWPANCPHGLPVAEMSPMVDRALMTAMKGKKS